MTHFITGEELTGEQLRAVLDRALELKREPLSSRACCHGTRR